MSPSSPTWTITSLLVLLLQLLPVLPPHIFLHTAARGIPLECKSDDICFSAQNSPLASHLSLSKIQNHDLGRQDFIRSGPLLSLYLTFYRPLPAYLLGFPVSGPLYLFFLLPGRPSLPPDTHMAPSLTSFRSLFKCHLFKVLPSPPKTVIPTPHHSLSPYPHHSLSPCFIFSLYSDLFS